MSPVVPDSPTIALQPPVHPARGDAEHELPEPELLGRKSSPLPLFDPGADGLVTGPGTEPLDRLPWTRSENTANDLLAITVPLE
jgi:hypothetical protein